MKTIGNLFSKALIAVLSIFIISGLNAEVFNAHIADVDSCTNFGANPSILGNTQVKINYLDLTYDDASETLTIELETDKSRGEIANLFHIVLTEGGMPQGEGHVAHLYFDASNPNDPKVTVYSYNAANADDDYICNNNPGSWAKSNASPSFTAAPDLIFSSINTPGVILESSVDTAADIVETTRFRLVIDVSTINAYTPVILNANYPYTYQGIKFGENIGIWFWAASDVTSWYDNGALTDLQTSICAICDDANVETKTRPVCQGSSSTANPVEYTKTTTITIEVNDPDYADNSDVPLLVSYNGTLPAGAKPSVLEGGAVTLDGSGNGVITITWTPTADQVGDHTIAATFSKDYGLDQLAIVCNSAKITVIPGDPDCKLPINSAIGQADQDSERLVELSKNLASRIKGLRNKLGIKRAKIDSFNANAIHSEQIWAPYNSIVSPNGFNTANTFSGAAKTLFFQCSEPQFCGDSITSLTLNSDLETFRGGLIALRDLTTSRAKKLRRLLVKKFIEINGLSKSKARRRAKRIINNKYLEAADGINPVFNSANALVDTYISTYGVTRFTCPGAFN